jgi:inner membrane transporter RhtA
MVLVQLGSALSTHLFDAVGPAGSAWLRLAVAGLVLLAVTRPRLRDLSRRALVGTALLGTCTGLLSLAFIEAVARIPLGTAVAVEFLGPLGVAAVRAHRRAALVWPALALAGVVALTRPWAGGVDLAGIGFALAAAAGWAGYLVLTQRVGTELEGLRPLALSMTVGAVVTAPLAAGPALSGLTPAVALAGIGLAVLTPLLPYALELAALRRMTLTAFGTLMALEPGIATGLGLVVLAQAPSPLQAAGVLLVVAAGIGAQRTARTCPASAAGSVEGRSQTNPRQTYAAA